MAQSLAITKQMQTKPQREAASHPLQEHAISTDESSNKPVTKITCCMMPLSRNEQNRKTKHTAYHGPGHVEKQVWLLTGTGVFSRVVKILQVLWILLKTLSYMLSAGYLHGMLSVSLSCLTRRIQPTGVQVPSLLKGLTSILCFTKCIHTFFFKPHNNI